MQSFSGYCGVTADGDEGDCLRGSQGSWTVGERLPDLEACTAACRSECPRCAFVSFSKKWSACDWFAQCRVDQLLNRVEGFKTVRVKDAAEVMDGAQAMVLESNRTLVLMVYHATANEHERDSAAGGKVPARANLRYFLKHGVQPALGNPRYKFVIANTGSVPIPSDWLPRRRHHTGDTFEVLNFNSSIGYEYANYKRSLVRLDALRSFSHFVLLPDSVRGPFLPSYVDPATWPDLLTSMLTPTIRLVGPSINCMYCHQDAKFCGEAGGGLHAQGFLIATDRVGVGLLMRHWRRPRDKVDSIMHNEVGGTPAIIKAGYNIAVLQRFWRNHDFRDKELTHAKCKLLTSHASGLGGSAQLGLPTCSGCQWGQSDLTPFEVMFAHRSIPGSHSHDYSEMAWQVEKLEAAASASALRWDSV